LIEERGDLDAFICKCMVCGVEVFGEKDFICESCADPEATVIYCEGCKDRIRIPAEEFFSSDLRKLLREDDIILNGPDDCEGLVVKYSRCGNPGCKSEDERIITVFRLKIRGKGR
jgi:hypothetical protein